MPQADGTILIDTEINADGMKAGSEEVEAAVRRMASSVTDLGTKARTALNKQVDSFSKLNKEYAAQAKKVEELKRKVAEYGNQKVPTEEYREIQTQIDQATSKMNRLIAQQERFMAMGGSQKSNTYKKYQYDIDELANTIRYAEGELRDLEETGKAFTFGSQTKEAAADMEKLAAAERKLSDMNNRLGTSYSSIKKQTKDLNSEISKTQILSNSLRKFGNSIQKAFYSLARLTGRTITSGLKKVSNGIFAINKSANKTSMSLAKMLGMSILFSTVFGAISAVNNGLKEGVNNLAVYSDEMNNSLSMLMSSLTQLKNSFATAFSPILTVVAPILSSFINLISRAVTYVGMFVAALTGQDSFVKAIGVQQDYRSSLSSTASSASGAADATNELADATENAADAAERYLSPLDDINRWQENLSGNNGSGGGSGGIGSPIDTGIVLPEDMFETVPIKNSIKNLADKIKKLIKSEDWEGLGEFIADGINKGLKKVYDAISWKNVGPKITAFTTAFAETFNSLVDHLDFDLLGRTVGAGINTIVNTINQLADKINWKNLGRKIAQGFNGLFDEVNWYDLGHLIGNRIRVVWDIFGGFVEDLDFAKIGRSVAEGLNGVFSKISFGDIAHYLATALNGAFDALAAFAVNFKWDDLVDNIVNGITAFIQDFEWTTNALKLTTFLNKLMNALADLAADIPWGDLGNDIGNFIGTALGSFDWNSLGEFLNAFITGLIDALQEIATVENFRKLGEGIATAIGGLPWIELLSTAVEVIKNAIAGLIGGIWDSENTSLVEKGILTLITGAAGLITISKLPIIGTLATNIVSWLAGKLMSTTAMTTISNSLTTLLSGASGAIKGLGETAKTAASGGFKSLLSAIGASGAGIGLIAVLPVAAELLAGFIEKLQGGNGKLSDMGGAINDLAGRLQNIGLLSSTQADEIWKIVDSCENAGMSAEEMATVVMEKFAEWGISTQNVNSVLEDNNYWTTKTKESVDQLAQSSQILGDGMSATAESIDLSSVSMQDGFKGIKDSLYELHLESDEFGGTYQQILGNLDQTTSSATTAQEAMDMIAGQLEAAGVPADEFIKKMQEKFPEAMKSVKTSVDTNMPKAREKFASETGSMKATAQSDFSNIESDAENYFGGVNDTTVLNWGNSAEEVKLNLRAMKLAASEQLSAMTETVRSYSQSMYNIMTKKFEYLARDVGTIIGSIGSNIRDQMNSVISIVNSAISSINYSISGIESAMNFGPWEIPTAFGSRIIGFHATFPRVPRIPYLASGAVIPPNKEFMAVLGDQKQGNNIEAPEGLIRRIVREESGRNGGNKYEIPLKVGRRELARLVIDEAKIIRNETGRNPFELV